ncbi:hypothetical protein GCM10011379_41910 [Filimonas zeae]|uniref:Uncharacterized protein n=1 Tax=Filimonas zeae TaxID=1737353 RepID=A0A917MXR8_9BACT|nr:hypothetical protein GCM10011379_41910 [Filimonas zeae]
MVYYELADKYNEVSPYIYVLNNQIVHIDPDAKDAIVARAPATFANTGGGLQLPFFPKTIHDLGVTGIYNGDKGVSYSKMRRAVMM